MVAIDQSYKLSMIFRSGQPGAHAELTQQLGAEFQEKFAGKAERAVVNSSPFAIPPGIFDVVLTVRDKDIIWDVNQWVIERVRPVLPESYAAMTTPADGRGISRARWVPMDSDWYNVERGPDYGTPANEYPIRCTTCRWPDFDAPPEPFLVDDCISKADKNELLPASNGIFVVSKRVLEILQSLVRSDFQCGPVVSRGSKRQPDPFFWIRPVHRIGAQLRQCAFGEPCSACGVPDHSAMLGISEGPPLSPIVEHFGQEAWNMALVGELPLGDTPRDQPSDVTRIVAITGGLFAALWNHGIKGLKWPRSAYISRVADESTWEATRRFGDLFPVSKDKAGKYKPK